MVSYTYEMYNKKNTHLEKKIHTKYAFKKKLSGIYSIEKGAFLLVKIIQNPK